jgi:hypothetical protein
LRTTRNHTSKIRPPIQAAKLGKSHCHGRGSEGPYRRHPTYNYGRESWQVAMIKIGPSTKHEQTCTRQIPLRHAWLFHGALHSTGVSAVRGLARGCQRPAGRFHTGWRQWQRTEGEGVKAAALPPHPLRSTGVCAVHRLARGCQRPAGRFHSVWRQSRSPYTPSFVGACILCHLIRGVPRSQRQAGCFTALGGSGS